MKYAIVVFLFLVMSVANAQAPLIQPNVRLEAQSPVQEGAPLEGTVFLTVRGPFSSEAFLRGEIESVATKMKLAHVLDELSLSYEIQKGNLQVTNPATARTLVFPSAGRQYTYLKLPKGSEIVAVALAVKGLPQAGSYPRTPTIDVGDDARIEWLFRGELLNFSTFILPNGLDEGRESGVVSIMNREDYFCEIINVTSAKDFEVSAKYAYGQDSSVANLRAVIFSFTGSGSTVEAQGGANSCAMPEPLGLGYRSCVVHFTTAIQGEHLVCVFNRNSGNGNLQQYQLAKDDAPGVGYRCDRLQNGRTTCQRQIADFFIKIKAGTYENQLRREATLVEGRTEYLLEEELEGFLQICVPIDSVYCVVPVSLQSHGPGILYLDDMQIKYRSGGSLFLENNLYEASVGQGYFAKLAGQSLTNATVNITVPLDLLGLFAPFVATERNATLRVGLDLGTAEQRSVRITKSAGANATSSMIGRALDEYKRIISTLVEQHSGLFAALDKGDAIGTAMEQLTALRDQWQNVVHSNLSENQKASEGATIMATVNALARTMPRAVVVLQSVSDVIVVRYDDVQESFLLADQHYEEARRKIYELQSTISVQGKAQLFEIRYFNNDTEKGTFVTKSVSGTGAGYLVERIPEHIAGARDVRFAAEPEVLQERPLTVRWPTSIGAIHYVIAQEVADKLDALKTIYIPQTLEGIQQEPLALCGDGVCSILEIDGEKTPLEDRLSCPQDCRPAYPWGVAVVAVLLIAAIVFYIYVYTGKYNFRDVFGKASVKKEALERQEKLGRTPFIAKRDEENLRNYVVTSLNKGLGKQKITRILLTKGWTDDQVEYIFKELKR